MICTVCGIDKEPSAFYTRRTVWGLKPRSHCKACHIAGITRWQIDHRGLRTSAALRYYYRNLEVRRAYQREYERRKREAENEL